MDSNNCLQTALDFWETHPDFRLWYNSNHVVSIEDGIDLTDKGYLPLHDFGFHHLISSFELQNRNIVQLEKYFYEL
jgi:hypothetical protein